MGKTLLESISPEEFQRARDMSRRKYESDMESNRLTIIYNAELNTAIRIATKMLQRGMNLEDIAKYTELPIEKVVEIKKELDTETKI